MPQTLTYDTLPPHSRLRREFTDGVLKITAAAEEPGPLVRREAARSAALPAALLCCGALVLVIALFGAGYLARRQFMPPLVSVVLFIAFVVLSAALYSLSWRMEFGLRIDAAEKALQQITILAASADRLIIESSGPLGATSLDLTQIRVIRIARTDRRPRISAIQIVSGQGAPVLVLHGRDDGELNWVARALIEAVGLSPSA
jgi:hypothetical protein